MVINMKDNNLKDLFQFLLNHKKLIQSDISVSQGSYSITKFNEGLCRVVENNVPFREFLIFSELMEEWPEKSDKTGFVVGIEGKDPRNVWIDYYENNKNMFGNCDYGQKRWELILFIYQELSKAKHVSYLEA